MPKKTASKTAVDSKLSRKRADQPATQGMLEAVRQELKHEMRSGFAEMNAKFAQVDSRFAQIDSRFAEIDSKIAGLDSKYHTLDSKLEKVLTSVSQMQIMFEEQRRENRAMLEGYGLLGQRIDKVEDRQNKVEQTMAAIAKAAKHQMSQ